MEEHQHIETFDIEFNFPIEDSVIKIPIKALAELHHSDPYYVIHSFRVATNKPKVKNDDQSNEPYSFLPEQRIKKTDENGHTLWVHTDSGKPTLLSMTIGKAIDDMA